MLGERKDYILKYFFSAYNALEEAPGGAFKKYPEETNGGF